MAENRLLDFRQLLPSSFLCSYLMAENRLLDFRQLHSQILVMFSQRAQP